MNKRSVAKVAAQFGDMVYRLAKIEYLLVMTVNERQDSYFEII